MTVKSQFVGYTLTFDKHCSIVTITWSETLLPKVFVCCIFGHRIPYTHAVSRIKCSIYSPLDPMDKKFVSTTIVMIMGKPEKKGERASWIM